MNKQRTTAEASTGKSIEKRFCLIQDCFKRSYQDPARGICFFLVLGKYICQYTGHFFAVFVLVLMAGTTRPPAQTWASQSS